MSDDNLLELSSRTRLFYEIMGLMMKGAGYAAVVVVGVWFFIYAIFLVGKLLPEESKEAADPTPLSFNEYVVPAASDTRVG